MSAPIVAIVGRPNVGKSTLFNRIIRQQKAIVDEQAGVTRDRHYTRTEWSGKEFTIVDTGGFLIHFKNSIDRGIRYQIEEAIDEADAVLLLTDVRSGITDIDKIMAKMLLKGKKPTILVVNKVDNARMESEAGVFMSLGLGEPSAVSALHGMRVGNLLDRILTLLPEKIPKSADEKSLSIAILGKPNVGKSSIVNALIGKNKMLVTEIPGTTRDSIDSYITRNGRLYRLIDTAGLRKRSKVYENIEYYSTLRTVRSLDQCHIAVIIVDAREGIQTQDLKIIDMAVQVKRGIVIALNKWDLIRQDKTIQKEVLQSARDKLKIADYIEILSTSAITKVRVFKLLDVCTQIFEEWNKTVETSELNKMVQEAITRHHPPAYYGKQVSIKYCTQTSSAPPVMTFFVNHPDGIGESYKRYLQKHIRKRFGFSGVPLTLKFKKK